MSVIYFIKSSYKCWLQLCFQEVKVKTENEEADKKLEDQEDEEIRELSAEERYTKLMDLLNKSKFYSKFLQV